MSSAPATRLAAALRLAEREQYRQPFALERRWIGPALHRDPDLVSTHLSLLAPVLRNDRPPRPVSVTQLSATPIVVPLSEREMEVLRHVSKLLSTDEVASEMYISVNTVKTHLRSIYRKLAATHRGEAVRRARQLELI